MPYEAHLVYSFDSLFKLLITTPCLFIDGPTVMESFYIRKLNICENECMSISQEKIRTSSSSSSESSSSSSFKKKWSAALCTFVTGCKQARETIAMHLESFLQVESAIHFKVSYR